MTFGEIGAPARRLWSWRGIRRPALGLALLFTAAPVVALPPVANDDSGTTRSGPTAGLEVAINAAANDTDPEGDPLDYTLYYPPANGTAIVGPSGTVRYTPNPGFVGTDSLVYEVSDGNSPTTAFATVSIDVVANLDPVAVPESVTAAPWPTATEIRVLDNDSDPDGDILAYRDIEIVTEPLHGFIEISCVGACTPPSYTPARDYAGPDSFTYRALDPLGGASAVTTVTIEVSGPPVAVDDTGESIDGGAVLVDVLANDTDPNGDSMTVAVATPPSGGTAVVTAGGILYTPDAGFTGPDSFTYVASDGVYESAPATVTIDFTFLPDPPVAANDTAVTAVGESVLIDVLANDTDPDGSAAELAVASTTEPANGTVVIVGRQVEYRPDEGFVGTDSFDYVVMDPDDLTDTGTVTVTVTAGNLPPTAVISGGNRSVPDSNGAPGERVTVDGSASSDSDGEIILYEWSVGGSVVPDADGPVVELDLADGPNTVSLRVFDDREAASAPVSVTITVATNAAPVAVIAGGNRTVGDSDLAEGEAVVMDGSASSDADGSVATYRWSVNGALVPGASGPTPTLNLADGPSTVALVVVDDFGSESAPASVVVTVTPANPGPTVTIAGGDRTIPDGDDTPGELVPFEGAATDDDGPVAVSTFRWSVNGTAVAEANGRADPILPLTTGANVVRLTATDSLGASGSTSVTVTVGEPNALSDLPDLSENQQSTAEATENVCSTLLKLDPVTLDAGQRDLRATCDALFAASGDADAVGQALDEISGQQVTAQQTTAIDFSHVQLVNIGARLRALRMGASGFSASGFNLASPGSGAPLSALASLGKVLFGEGGASGDDEGGLFDRRLGVFVNGSLRWGSKDATDRESGFDFDSEGVTVGADYRFTDGFVAGLALGYASANADLDRGAGQQDSEGVSGSLYGSWYGDKGYVDTIVSYGQVTYDSIRNIEIASLGISDTALGDTDGTQWAAGLGGGLDFGKGALRFGPTGSVNYVRVDIDAFSERTTGSSGLAMRFAEQSAESLVLKAGGQIAYQLSRNWGILSPQARFDIVHELMNDAQRVTVRFANTAPGPGPGTPGDSFVIFTDDPDRNYFNWAVGLAATFANGFSGFVDYESVAGLDTIASEELSFGLRYEARFR